MEYTTEFDEAEEICIVRVKGQHKRPEDSLILQQLARDIEDEQGYQRFLFDMRQAEIRASNFDTFTTGTVPIDPDRRQTRQRIALVYVCLLAVHKFMETVAVNRGYQLKVFDQMDEALAWLGSNRSSESHRQ